MPLGGIRRRPCLDYGSNFCLLEEQFFCSFSDLYPFIVTLNFLRQICSTYFNRLANRASSALRLDIGAV